MFLGVGIEKTRWFDKELQRTEFFLFAYSLAFLSRLNKKPPNISLKRKEKGGINLTMTVRVYTKNCKVDNNTREREERSGRDDAVP